jgi:ABC-type glycerol-3-phosphate transport system permease component
MVDMATLPILILYLYAQRFFVAGIASTGVKG